MTAELTGEISGSLTEEINRLSSFLKYNCNTNVLYILNNFRAIENEIGDFYWL